MTPEKFSATVTNHWKFRFFLISRLPMAWLAGLRVTQFSDETSEVRIKFKYLTKNPFRSIYFACLAMAAELSTGVFGFRYAQLARPRASMLVTGMKATYHKKAVGTIRFVCKDGKAIEKAVASARESGAGVTIQVLSQGYDAQNELVAEFTFEWSFKVKA